MPTLCSQELFSSTAKSSSRAAPIGSHRDWDDNNWWTTDDIQTGLYN